MCLIYTWYKNYNITKFLLSTQVMLGLKPLQLFKVYVFILTCIFSYELIYSLVPLFNDFL